MKRESGKAVPTSADQAEVRLPDGQHVATHAHTWCAELRLTHSLLYCSGGPWTGEVAQ
jgi:hypothetical protein